MGEVSGICLCPAFTSQWWNACHALIAQALGSVFGSWLSRKFFGGCAVLFPMVVTVYITWWFLTFFDNFFSVSFSLHALHKEVLLPDAWHTHSSQMSLQCIPRPVRLMPACACSLCMRRCSDSMYSVWVLLHPWDSSLGQVQTCPFSYPMPGALNSCPDELCQSTFWQNSKIVRCASGCLAAFNAAEIPGMFRCVCVILAGRTAAASGRVDHQEAATCQAHLLCSQAGQCVCRLGDVWFTRGIRSKMEPSSDMHIV